MDTRRTFSLVLMTAGLMLVAASQSWATVTVTFAKPEKYTDVPRSPAERERLLQELKAHLTKLGTRLPQTYDMALDIADIDLAGDLRPALRQTEVRILNGRADWPSMHLHYSIESNGKVIQSGDEFVANMNYLKRVNPYPSGDSLRYEKQMLDEWFSKKFPVNMR